MKTTFIIGSGVSYYSKIPGISDITNSILTAENIGRGTDLNYYFEGYLDFKINHNLKDNITSCQKIIRLVKENIDNFYYHINFEHQTNYEDIYYVIKQIHDSYSLEFENPVILKFIEQLLLELNYNINDFKELIKESLRFIECVVWQSIDRPNLVSSQFDIILEIIKNFSLNTILSLNHDLILENWLHNKGIKYDDGFHLFGNRKLFEWQGFKNNPNEIKLCKVHGSIDWFELKNTNPSLSDNIFKIPRNFHAEKINILDKSIMATNAGIPALLIGTFNKMLGYLSGIHELMFEELKSTIKDSELLIVSGYGFGDKGINTRLTNWLSRDTSKKMILIHPNKENLINNSRGAFKIKIMNKDWKHSKVELIEKKFEEVKIEVIIKALA